MGPAARDSLPVDCTSPSTVTSFTPTSSKVAGVAASCLDVN
jgi:hypothetical protein